MDIALSSCGSRIAKTWVPQAAAAGTVCIDNSSAFRMEPWARLVIPEVNPEAIDAATKVNAVPNCTIITTLMAVAPLHRAAGLRSLIVCSYQSVTGAGAKGLRELAEQVEKLHGMEEELGRSGPDALPVGEVFGKTIAYNVVAKIDVFDPESGYSFEEIKMQREARRILSMPELTSPRRASASRCRSATASALLRVVRPGDHGGGGTAGPRRRAGRPAPRRPGQRRLPESAGGGRPRRRARRPDPPARADATTR